MMNDVQNAHTGTRPDEGAINRGAERNRRAMLTGATSTIARVVQAGTSLITVPLTIRYLGNERFGLDADQLKLCDEVRKIPTFGVKNSLNAATAAAIAGYEWRKQWNEFQVKA